jgi:hypothetical protein
VKPLTPAKTRRRMGIFLTETPPTASLKHLIRPLFPATTFSPPSGLAQRLFRSLPQKANS